MSLFDTPKALKEKVKAFNTNRKKIKALDRYRDYCDFTHDKYLKLVKMCMRHGFLEKQESDFLNYMIDKYFITQHFLDWSYKSKWLKKEMRDRDEKKKEKIQQLTLFPLPEIKPLHSLYKRARATI